MKNKQRFLLRAALSVILAMSWGTSPAQVNPTAAARQEFLKKLVAAAVERTQHVVRYEPE